MKEWFGYKYGYVNIDTDWIYLNNSGVWSDLKEVEEYDSKHNMRFRNNTIRASIFMYPAIALLAVGSVASFIIGIKNVGAGNTKFIFNFVASILAGIGTFYTYNYFKNDLGIVTKIKRNSVLNITSNEEKIEITFSDINQTKSKLEILKPDSKGIKIMKNLNPMP